MEADQQKSGYLQLMTLLLATLLCVVSQVNAEPHQSPVDVLQSMTDTLIEIVREDPDVVNNLPRLRQIASDVVLTNVDFEALSRWVLGKHWRRATPQQRAGFIMEFREVLLGTYLRSVSSYQDNSVRFAPARGKKRKGLAIVNAEVDQPNGPVIHVAFRMRSVNGQWLIYDIVVEGISLVATHRTSFSREIRNRGMDSLIARLHAKNIENSEQEKMAANTKAAQQEAAVDKQSAPDH